MLWRGRSACGEQPAPVPPPQAPALLPSPRLNLTWKSASFWGLGVEVGGQLSPGAVPIPQPGQQRADPELSIKLQTVLQEASRGFSRLPGFACAMAAAASFLSQESSAQNSAWCMQASSQPPALPSCGTRPRTHTHTLPCPPHFPSHSVCERPRKGPSRCCSPGSGDEPPGQSQHHRVGKDRQGVI